MKVYNNQKKTALQFASWRPAMKFWSPELNFWLHWRPGRRNFGPFNEKLKDSGISYHLQYIVHYHIPVQLGRHLRAWDALLC